MKTKKELCENCQLPKCECFGVTTKPQQHTPTPWELMNDLQITCKNTGAGVIATCYENSFGHIQAKWNAAFIVRAVNAYESDQERIRVLVEAATAYLATASSSDYSLGCQENRQRLAKAIKQARGE